MPPDLATAPAEAPPQAKMERLAAPDHLPRLPARLVGLAAVALLGYAVSLYLDLPGHFEPDSLWQLAQGKTGVFNDWHPPVMAWLLGLAARVSPDAWPFIVFDGALFFAAMPALVALEPRPRLIAIPLLALMLASPLVLVYQGVVWKDVLFANASVGGFTALAWAGRLWRRSVWRYSLLALAFALMALAALTRQNGLVVPVCGAAALAAISFAERPLGESRLASAGRAGAFAAAALALVALVNGAATLQLEAHGDHVPETLNNLKRMQVWDLAGEARLEPRLPLTILHRDAPDVERFIRLAAAHYHAAGVDNLEDLPGADEELIPDGDAIIRQWWAMIFARPDLYLRTRAAVFSETFRAPSEDGCPIYFVGVDPDHPDLLSQAGMTARYDANDAVDEAYSDALTKTPISSHLTYLVILLVVGGMAARRLFARDWRPELIVTAAMALAALLFVASFFVMSVSCDYRYLYFMDVTAMAVLLRRAAARDGPLPARKQPRRASSG